MVFFSNGVLLDGNSTKRSVENGFNLSFSGGAPPKHKPQRITVVRNFPAGCGRNVPRISGIQSEENTVALGETEGVDTVVADGEVVGVTGVVNSVPEKKFSSEVKHLGVELFKDMENDISEGSKKLNRTENQVLIKESDEMEGLALVKCGDGDERKTVLEIGAVGDRATVVSVKSLAAPQWMVADSGVEEEKVPSPKNKFQRRRVLATRDFPSFCGRNAPTLFEEDAVMISGNNSLHVLHEASAESKFSTEAGTVLDGGALCDELRGGVEDEAVRKAVMAGVEESRGVQDGNSVNIQLKKFVPEPRKFSTVIKKENEGFASASWVFGKDIEVYSENECLKGRSSDDVVGLGGIAEREIVQGLAAAPSCPWRQEKRGLTSADGDIRGTKIKKFDFAEQKKSKHVTRTHDYEVHYSRGTATKGRSVSAGKAAYRTTGTKVVRNNEDHVVFNGEQHEDFLDGQKLCDFDVCLPPFGPKSSSSGDARNRVRETLRLFQAICRKLLQGEESKSNQQDSIRRIDLEAAKIIRLKQKEVNTGERIVGAVPGVEVGDEFQYRVELAIVGVHRVLQGGIDSITHDGEVIATSIVASGAYADDLENADVLTYSGQGGNIVDKKKEPEDQKLQRGNLALKNSISVKNPVRVIRGWKETKASESLNRKAKVVTSYVYDGLYTVEKYWTDTGPHGKLVFMFELRRIPGQAELAWKEVKWSKSYRMRKGVCVDDISGGKESLPICAVNMIDGEKPAKFSYTTRVIYPKWYCPVPPQGCDCTGRCSVSRKCLCAAKNGGEIPYNYNGAIVEAKPLVYECGPSCKCSPSCYNRVSQHGTKIQLEIFKTENRGWGVRSLSSIPSGSFICEYTGKLLEDKEAEQRIGHDEYLFDIGQNYNDFSQRSGTQSNLIEVGEDGGYTIDAAQYGNVGRFINHSCSPNLYAQNVLYDHEDKRMPHIMLFAAENIPPLQELAYHYNYSVDAIHDLNGDIKMKSCFCGSAECTGRMY